MCQYPGLVSVSLSGVSEIQYPGLVSVSISGVSEGINTRGKCSKEGFHLLLSPGVPSRVTDVIVPGLLTSYYRG